MSDTFFFFGCWNKDPINCYDMKTQSSPSVGAKGSAPEREPPVGAANAGPAVPLEKEEVDYRKIILDYISKNIISINLYYTGDNIYPHKDKEKSKAKSTKNNATPKSASAKSSATGGGSKTKKLKRKVRKQKSKKGIKKVEAVEINYFLNIH